jgi:Cd(II)/Pb(II)-responsive transcriptional regulator
MVAMRNVVVPAGVSVFACASTNGIDVWAQSVQLVASGWFNVVFFMGFLFAVEVIRNPVAASESSQNGITLQSKQGWQMKIGELAKATGAPVETIRFYEREGLLSAPERTSGNYRMYGADHAKRLAFIRNCRTLDMTLNEIRKLLLFKEAPTANCGDVNLLLDAQIDRVSDRIRDMKALEKSLKELRAQCVDASASKACAILQGLCETASFAAARLPRSGRQSASGTGRVRPSPPLAKGTP